jgi:hypothetical protein
MDNTRKKIEDLHFASLSSCSAADGSLSDKTSLNCFDI